MTFPRTAFKVLSFLLGTCWLLAGVYSPAAARRRHYVNKHTVSTTRVVAPGVTVLRGRASWYGRQFQGHRTTSGELFNRFKYTCAHRTLPFGTHLRVTSVRNHKSVVVRVTDRGPFRHQRILDLAEIAARPLGIVDQGAATVVAEVVALDTPLGPADAPANLSALLDADPDPSAAHATFAAPALASTSLAAAIAPADSPAAAAAVPVTLTATAPAKPDFLLQAGTFADPQNAQALQARLLALAPELPVAITTETVNGRELHRVIVSQLDSWLAAETVRRRLQVWGIAGLVRQLPASPVPPTAPLAATSPPATAASQ